MGLKCKLDQLYRLVDPVVKALSASRSSLPSCFVRSQVLDCINASFPVQIEQIEIFPRRRHTAHETAGFNLCPRSFT